MGWMTIRTHFKDLFATKFENNESNARKMSSASTGSMKSKWIKAFKILKAPSGPSNGSSKQESEKKSARDGGSGGAINSLETAHQFQEYTYKKITPCDVCSQVLRGHTRQGLKCRLCKMNVHLDCQDKATSKCNSKSRLLRRQKSTSEIETRISATQEEEERATECPDDQGQGQMDDVYQVLKQAGEMTVGGVGSIVSGGGGGGAGRPIPPRNPIPGSGSATGLGPGSDLLSMKRTNQPPSLLRGPSSLSVVAPPIASSSAPHSPRRHKLNLRMKSLSLDSPESTEHVQRRRTGAGAGGSSQHVGGVEPHSSHSSSSRLQSPSSPVHNRRLLSARNMRMSSVELPDDNEKSLSSASTSPCPSPKPHRLLPTNLYVVLYNFKARHGDELDLKAGYKVTVIDSSDQDWWKGKCLGRVGFFPSKYVTKVQPGERPLQVIHNLQVKDGDCGLTLLRDQIVIQVGEEVDGTVMIRNGDNRQGFCPVKYLQEV